MFVTGYSERGLLNSLIYEIRYSDQPVKLLEKLFSLFNFPFNNPVLLPIDEAEMLIEQSFSDFGDADLVFLIKSKGKKYSIFTEAKVKNYRGIHREYQKFIEKIDSKVASSNIFVQLYFKVRLTSALKFGIKKLEDGVEFPASSSKPSASTPVRKIGQNKVVLKAINLLKNFIDETYYITILPDEENLLEDFYKKILKNSSPNLYVEWNTMNYGYVSWNKIEQFCRDNNLRNTLKLFEYNKGLIY